MSAGVGWQMPFDAEKTAWTGEYKELKAALTEEEYAAARASTLNAHYTSPTVIRAIYEALDSMGFEKGNSGTVDGCRQLLRYAAGFHAGEQALWCGTGFHHRAYCAKLYPQAEIKVAGFETTDRRDFMIWPWAMCLWQLPCQR